MDLRFRIFPERGSTIAWKVDDLFFFELAVSVLFVALIAGLIVFFAIKYRRRSDNDVPPYTPVNPLLEFTYIVTPLGIMLIYFALGTWIFLESRQPPVGAMQINVIGKQWMWKIQHPEGPREINTLHVPIGRPIKLLMASQDVIHDFGLPDFRVKQDVIPGRYATEWFEATKPGEYQIFCDQYCGALHSRMIGKVVAMEPQAYQAWLTGHIPNDTPASSGSRLFQSYGCAACHGQRAPSLAGLYGSRVLYYDNGGTELKSTIADENYLRESIVEPAAKLVPGYGPIMPSFQGQLTEEQIFDLIEYIKSLGSAMDTSVKGALPNGPQTRPTTQPVNGQWPDLLPNQPPARQPPTYKQTGEGSETQ